VVVVVRLSEVNAVHEERMRWVAHRGNRPDVDEEFGDRTAGSPSDARRRPVDTLGEMAAIKPRVTKGRSVTERVDRTCQRCGSTYELASFPLPARDKDQIDCEVCGEELISWNGGVMWSAKLVTRGTPPTSGT
jgi:hypothetical protein